MRRSIFAQLKCAIAASLHRKMCNRCTTDAIANPPRTASLWKSARMDTVDSMNNGCKLLKLSECSPLCRHQHSCRNSGTNISRSNHKRADTWKFNPQTILLAPRSRASTSLTILIGTSKLRTRSSNANKKQRC